MTRTLAWLALLVLLLSGPLALPARGAPSTEADNLLVNGGFEGDFYPVGAGQVAVGWTRVHLSGNPNWMSTRAFANGGWIERIERENSQILSVENLGIGQPYETVLYQRVTGLQPGEIYSLSGWVLKMWGGSANPSAPEDPYSFASWIGIDPTGGTDPTAPSVMWDEQHWQMERQGRWINHRMAAEAESGAMTVFVRLWLKWQRAETQAIVDGWELYEAPHATITSPVGYTREAGYQLTWNGDLPHGLATLGNYALYYEVQQEQTDGSWRAIATDLREPSTTISLADGQYTRLRVLPYSFQPIGENPHHWPPSTHVGLPSEPVPVMRDSTAPSVSLAPLPAWQEAAPFPVTWSGDDIESGVLDFDVDYRRAGSSEWIAWLRATPGTSGTFGEENEPTAVAAGDRWEIRVRARDRAGNESSWSNAVTTGLAGAVLRGRVVSANGHVVQGARVTAAEALISTVTVGPLGEYEIPFAEPGTYTLSFVDARGDQRLPDTTVEVADREETAHWSLLPADSRVINGTFEGLAGWSPGWEQVAGGASGAHAARLQAGETIHQTVQVATGDGLSLAWLAEGEGAQVRIQLGSENWLESADGSGWQRVYHRTEHAGEQQLTLTAVAGTVRVDDAAVGTPEAPTNYLFVPLIDQ